MSARSKGRAIALIALLSLAACYVGGWKSEALVSPHGAAIEIRKTGYDQRYDGELLLVRGDGVVVLLSGRATLAPWNAIGVLTFDGVPVDDVRGGSIPMSTHHAQMQQVSRYPYGLTDEQMEQLLTSLGQLELEEF